MAKIRTKKKGGVLGAVIKSALATTMLSGVFVLSVPQASLAGDDSARVSDLERRLEESLRRIEKLSGEVNKLKRQRTSVKVGGSLDNETAARLDELEDTVFNLDEKVGSRAVVNAFDAAKLDLGAFIHSTVTHVNGEDGSATSFNRHIFELLLKAELGENWEAFVAQAFLRQSAPQFDDNGDGTSAAGERRTPNFNGFGKGPVVTDTPLAWVNYRHNDNVNIRFGRLITPHGIINIEHFPPILLDPEQPQFLRPFSGDTIFPNFLTGVQFHGKEFVKNDLVEYSLYTGNFTGNNENLVTGARVSYNFSDHGVTLGANGSFGERLKTAKSDYTMYGFDVLYDKGPVIWKNEVFATSEDSGNDRLGYYLQPGWRIDDAWTAFYRYDFLDNGGTTGETTEHMLGLNFTPNKNVRLRATATQKEFDSGVGTTDAEAQIYQLSATISF